MLGTVPPLGPRKGTLSRSTDWTVTCVHVCVCGGCTCRSPVASPRGPSGRETSCPSLSSTSTPHPVLDVTGQQTRLQRQARSFRAAPPTCTRHLAHHLPSRWTLRGSVPCSCLRLAHSACGGSRDLYRVQGLDVAHSYFAEVIRAARVSIMVCVQKGRGKGRRPATTLLPSLPSREPDAVRRKGLATIPRGPGAPEIRREMDVRRQVPFQSGLWEVTTSGC